ncbi:MAG: outer membrane beta-barrel protein [Proteobacteria bacterium]|nr:outer membrane beta-barrel protein [Pseudomonadota bacterium]
MKKNLIRGVVSASVSLLAFSAAASDFSDKCNLIPYIGADAQWRHMEFKEDYGKNVTKKNYPQANIYAGLKLHENVGFEVGYEQSSTLKRKTTLPGVATVFGISLPAILGNNQYNLKTKINAFHANLVGFFPLSEEYCVQLIGSLGVARSKIKMSLNIPVFDSRAPLSTIHRDFSKRKWIPKIGVGLQHMLTCQFGIRGMVNWEETSRFKNISVVNVTSKYIAHTKNSYSLGLGAFYNFK